MSSTAAAARLGITPQALYRMIDDGAVPAYRVGRVIRLRVADLDTFIESCRIEPDTITDLYPETDDRDSS